MCVRNVHGIVNVQSEVGTFDVTNILAQMF